MEEEVPEFKIKRILGIQERKKNDGLCESFIP